MNFKVYFDISNLTMCAWLRMVVPPAAAMSANVLFTLAVLRPVKPIITPLPAY